ncbi:MAG: class I SAM-dependent methyltransferase [Syntrophorhabdaceae bacterium]|nr:class I SAM-dependent methyltransferase [Syntrophorhabdaceae bacterium]
MHPIVKTFTTPDGLKNLIFHFPVHWRALKVRLFADKDFYKPLGKEKNDYDRYFQEIRGDELNIYLEKELEIFSKIKGKTVRGCEYSSGAISRQHGHCIYVLVRMLKPEKAVETGTANGYSTSFILKAMERNKKGMLYSIDFPEIEGKEYSPDDFYREKGGAVVPKNKTSGWLVPDELRARLKLFTGRSQDVLPGLLSELGEIDLFFHDSEHTYMAMMEEFNIAWRHLKDRGILLAHDVNWNKAFTDFGKKIKTQPFFIDGSLGFLIK